MSQATAVSTELSDSEVFSMSALAECHARRSGTGTILADAFDRGIKILGGYPKVSADFETQVAYWDMRVEGQSHAMAEILATRKFPGVRTDATFNEGRCNGNQFEATPGLGDHYRGIAEASGVSTTGKTYMSGLALFPGDPRAWVNDRHDVGVIARERGLNVEGYVNYRAPECEPTPDIPIDPALVRAEVLDIMDSNPGLDREHVEEVVTSARTKKASPDPVPDDSGDWSDIDFG